MSPQEELFASLLTALVQVIGETLTSLEARVRELEQNESRALHRGDDD
jgi:hypothetical protein